MDKKIKIVVWIGLLCFFTFIVTPFCQIAFCAKTNNISAVIADLANSAERDIEKQFSECPRSTIKNVIEQFKRELRSELKEEISEKKLQVLKTSFTQYLKSKAAEWQVTIDIAKKDFGGKAIFNIPWRDLLTDLMEEYKKAILSPIPSDEEIVLIKKQIRDMMQSTRNIIKTKRVFSSNLSKRRLNSLFEEKEKKLLEECTNPLGYIKKRASQKDIDRYFKKITKKIEDIQAMSDQEKREKSFDVFFDDLKYKVLRVYMLQNRVKGRN